MPGVLERDPGKSDTVPGLRYRGSGNLGRHASKKEGFFTYGVAQRDDPPNACQNHGACGKDLFSESFESVQAGSRCGEGDESPRYGEAGSEADATGGPPGRRCSRRPRSAYSRRIPA